MSRPCLDLEIGTALATMHSLRQWGVPDPDEWTFTPYSSTMVRGDGRSVGFGLASATWTWNFLSQRELDVFLSFFAAAGDASVEVYIYTYRDNGAGLTDMRARFSAVMHRPVDGSGKSMINESRKPTYSDVTVSFTYMASA